MTEHEDGCQGFGSGLGVDLCRGYRAGAVTWLASALLVVLLLPLGRAAAQPA